MTYRLNDRQYEAVRRLPPAKRYEHLVKRGAAYAELWALKWSDGWVLGADDDGRQFLPVWPHPRYAEAAATGGWEGSAPEPIEIHEWLDTLTPELQATSRLVGIFPVDGQESAVIDPTAFADDLRDELSLME